MEAERKDKARERLERAKFFSQYYDQEIMMYNDSDGDPFWSKQIYPVDAKNLQVDLSLMHLVLKPLSAITDEDAIEVAKITGCVKPSFDRYLNYLLIRDDDDQSYPLGRSGFTYKILFSDQSIELVINGRIGQITNQLAVFDYLRSKGYALPFMGISVEKQVQSGWVKLITDK